MTAGERCTGCGRLTADCPDDGHCASQLDPPRFCRRCGRRLAVQVYPSHFTARCPADPSHSPA